MTDVQDETTEIADIVEEAKETFSLVDRIKNRGMRTVKLDLGYDELNSEKLELIEAQLAQLNAVVERGERNSAGIDEFKKLRTKKRRELNKANAEDKAALEDELAAIEVQIEQRTALAEGMAELRVNLDELNKVADKIRAEVAANSISVELRALPYPIAKGAARRAKKYLGIAEKGVPDGRMEDFIERQLIELAYDQVVRYRDNATGEEGTKLDIEVIETFRDFLPGSQSGKFFQAVNDLQFTNAISESAIQQADF